MKSHNTAMSRKTASAPLRTLDQLSLIRGSVLDYGCGRGADARYLMKNDYPTESYDPYWDPKDLGDSTYDTVLCTFVLNVVEASEEKLILDDLRSRLSDGGRCFISVRRDIKIDGPTSRGYQRNVVLDLPVVKEKKGNY